jgi:carboxypeptidase C (cathepsin A)
MRNWNRILGLALGLVAASAVAALGQEAEKREAAKDDAKAPDAAPPAAASHHRITIDGKSIAYTSTAATIDLQNAAREPIGRMFYVAHTADGVADPRTRPVTFCFNGGPGSASLWLEMGSFGPMRVEASDAKPTPPPPYAVVENPESLLDRTDLVFIDAMGTGFSRILPKGKPADFYGTDPDIAAFAQFIQRWVSANGRWNSPKFLLGESYGVTRAAGLLNDLQRRGMAFNGAVMVSSFLSGYDQFNGPPFSNDLAYELYLPTVAAAAWYHGKVNPKPAELAPFLDEVRQFALGDYARALARGSELGESERAAVLERLRRYTGLPEDFLRQADLRVDPFRFEKELLRGERRTIGRLDGRFRGIDHDAAGENPESDASSDAFGAAYVAAWNTYLHDGLAYKTDELYKPFGYAEVQADWDERHTLDGARYPTIDMGEDLRRAMTANPSLKIFAANGYYDFATPFFATEYRLRHMGLDPAVEKNLAFGYYEGGHMMYVNPEARKKLKTDLARFYDAAAPRS